MIATPTVTFSKWVRWNERRVLRDDDVPWGGVYLFGCFADSPAESPEWSRPDSEIVYVGETKNLRPLTVLHNRIPRYRQVMSDPALEHLWVSVCRIFQTGSAEELLLRAFSQFVEASIDWGYTRTHHRRPALHFKEKRKDSGD